MEITLSVFGFLRKEIAPAFSGGHSLLDLEEGITLHYLLDRVLGLEGVDKIVLVNGKYVAPNCTLKDRDRVQIFSPIAGG